MDWRDCDKELAVEEMNSAAKGLRMNVKRMKEAN